MKRKESTAIELQEERSSVDTSLPNISVQNKTPSSATTSTGSGGVILSIGWILPRILAVIFFVVLFVWIFQAEGGFGWDESNLFGWHALLMALFVVLFTQESVLGFSAPLISGPFREKRSQNQKMYFHILYHVLGIASAMLGIVAIVYYKNLSPPAVVPGWPYTVWPVYPFFAVYSPHSWLGITVLILWAIQLSAGIYVHLIGPTPNDKNRLAKLHRFMGKVIYVAGLATCALGLQDMQSSDLAGSTPPLPGVFDTMQMGGGMIVVSGNSTINVTGYYPNSLEAQYSCACTVLLLLLGMATAGTWVQ